MAVTLLFTDGTPGAVMLGKLAQIDLMTLITLTNPDSKPSHIPEKSSVGRPKASHVDDSQFNAWLK